MQPAAAAKGVSVAIAIILLIVGVAVGAAVGYFGAPRGGTTVTNAALCSSGKTLTIGELLDLSSDLSSQGVRAKDSSVIAINDINGNLTKTGCNLQFKTAVDDYALNNDKALTQLQSLAASGVQVVVGPLNSGAAQNILQYADSNHIVLISPSSTSPALALPDDYLFRTVPNDAAQGLADARMISSRNATHLIILNRDDTYGNGLANATKVRFQALGGTVDDTIKYATTTTDFTAQLTTLYNDFQTANTTAPNKVAIDAVSFEEFGTMITQANTQHPTLLNGKLPWFGTDGEAVDLVIANQTTSGPYAAKVRLSATLYASANNTKTLDLYNRMSINYPGQTCDSYCLGAYDDLWLAALATLQAGSYDGAAIQKVMLSTASNMYGVTGPMGLQASGDRVPTSYQIWKLVIVSGLPKWVLAGNWDQATDTVTWSNPP